MTTRFTAGDELEAGSLQAYLHGIMMTNELRGGLGAYEVSNAILAESGPSFGPIQYDLGGNENGRTLFNTIAGTALDADGNRIIDDATLTSIQTNLFKPFNQYTDDDWALYETVKPQMNRALDSEVGREAINQDYLTLLGNKVEALNTFIDGIEDPENQAFMRGNTMAQLMVLDTRNQYGTAVNDGMNQLIGMTADDPAMAMPGRSSSPEDIGVNGELGLDDLIRYKLETKYGQSDAGAGDVLRRISNIIETVGVENVELSAEDRNFLVKDLAQYVVDNERSASILESENLAPLRALAERAMAEDPELQAWRRDNPDARSLVPVDPMSDGNLSLDERGPAVGALQDRLRELDIRDAEGQPIQTDEHYGGKTQHAVSTYQRDNALPETGVADVETLRSLGLERLLPQEQAPTQSEQGQQGQQGQQGAEDQRQGSLSPPPISPLLDHSAHPLNPMFGSTLDATTRADLGMETQQTRNVAGAITAAAVEGGMSRVDTVAPSRDGSNLFAIQGAVDSDSHRRVMVDRQQAVGQTLEQSTERVDLAASQRQSATLLAQNRDQTVVETPTIAPRTV
jgi:peptidoglycan hydrolase-like protein with peptidoglycan-binding domain